MSMRTDLVSEASAGDDIFAEFKNEAEDVMKRYVNECHHNWKRATAQFGNKALLVFSSNDRIQKEVGLSAVQTRQILLGTERIADKWGSVERQIRYQAVKILEQCLITVMEPNLEYKPLEVINSNTFVDRKELVFIRVWKSRREGRAYQHALKSLTQTRQDICLPPTAAVPYSVGLVLQARFVTVTWLVPLIHPIAHAIPTGSIMEQIEQAWKAAMGLPPSTEKDSEPVPLYVGGDGRYYAVTIKVLTTSLTNTVAESTRHERYEYNSRDDQVELVRTGLTASPDAHTRNGVHDRLLPALTKRMKDLKSLLNSPDDYIAQLFHCCGVNMQSLLYVREEVVTGLHESDVQFTPLAQRGDFEKAKRFIIQSIDNEVAARGLKTLILGKIAEALRGVTTAMPKQELEGHILQCSNSVITGFFRSSKFIRNYLLPVVCRKFTNAPEYEIDMQTIHFVKVMRHLEDRLGLHFDKSKKEFDTVKPTANVLSTTGRRQIPYCPLNDAASIGFEFLTAQKGLKKDADMTRRTLTTLLALNISATGINLSIEGSFAVFTESMSDALIKHGQVMERDLQQRGLHQAKSSALITKTQSAPSPLKAPRTERVAPHLLLTGILGELVQKESPAITLSEFDLLYRIPEIIVLDKMYVAERCQVLYDTFTSYPDDEVKQIAPLILNLWGRAISRGVDNLDAHDVALGELDSDRNFFQEATRQHALPTVANLERFSQLVTDESVAARVNALPPDGRNDLLRGLIVASIVVDKYTAERSALFIISFCDGLYNTPTQILHPAMVDALLVIHDALPISSALAFVIAVLLAPTLMQLPSAMRVTTFVCNEVQRIKQRRRLLLPGQAEIYPLLCSGGLVLRQFQLNIQSGEDVFNKYQEAKEQALRASKKKVTTPWDLEGGTSTGKSLTVSDDDEDGGIYDDDDDDASTVVTQRAVPKRVGYKVVDRMLRQFLLNPEAIERLEFRLLEELYEQQHMILQEYCWRAIFHDEWERIHLRYACHQSRDLLCRELLIDQLVLAEWFKRNLSIQFQEQKRRLVIFNAHQRGIFMDMRDVFMAELELEMLHTICRQKIKERVERQERDARHRRETKYLTASAEFTEDGIRELVVKVEHEAISVIFGRAFIEGALQLDWEWRQREQRVWLLQHLGIKEFEQRQKVAVVGFSYPIILTEWAWRKDLARTLLRESVAAAEDSDRALVDQQRQRSDHILLEHSKRLRQHVEEEAAFRHFILPKALQIRLRFHNQQCSDVELDERLEAHEIICHFERERMFLSAAELKQREVVLLEDHDRSLQLQLQYGVLKANEATYFLDRIETTERRSRMNLIDVTAQDTWFIQEFYYRGRIMAQETATSQAHLRTYAKLKTSYFALRREQLDEQQALRREEIGMQSLYTPQEVLTQLVVLAVAGVEDIRKKERRHFAALISALNIEETSEGPRHDEQRLTTQARRRVIDVEFVIRRKFVMEEKRGRMPLDELHSRLYIEEEQEAERLEWWALFAATRQYVLGEGGSGGIGGDGGAVEYAVYPMSSAALPPTTMLVGPDYSQQLRPAYPFHRSKLELIMGPQSPNGHAVYSTSAEELLRDSGGANSALMRGPFGQQQRGASRRNYMQSPLNAPSPYPPTAGSAGSPRHLTNLLNTFATTSSSVGGGEAMRLSAVTPEVGALFPSIHRRREAQRQHGSPAPQQQQQSPRIATSMVPTPPRQASVTSPRQW